MSTCDEKQKIYTYMFTYDANIDMFGEIDFCATTKEEAIEMFNDWAIHESGYGKVIEDYDISIVYDSYDHLEYGDQYAWCAPF